MNDGGSGNSITPTGLAADGWSLLANVDTFSAFPSQNFNSSGGQLGVSIDANGILAQHLLFVVQTGDDTNPSTHSEYDSNGDPLTARGFSLRFPTYPLESC